MNTEVFFKRAAEYFSIKGFQPLPVPSGMEAFNGNIQFFQKSVRAGVFKGSDNYLLLQLDSFPEKEQISEIHETFRSYVNSKIKTPRIWRFSVPNIITVICGSHHPGDELLDYIRNIKRPWQGGEVHNVVYIDAASLSVYGHGTTEYNIEGMFTMPMKNIDPSNRSFYFVRDLCAWCRTTLH